MSRSSTYMDSPCPNPSSVRHWSAQMKGCCMTRVVPSYALGLALCIGLVAALVAGCAESTEPDRPPAEAATSEGDGPGEPEHGQPEEHTPEPALPGLADLLDAAMGGPVPLDELIVVRLRDLQHEAGDRPMLTGDGTWPELGDALLDLAEALPAHGISMSVLPDGLVEEVTALRDHIVQADPWEGDLDRDVATGVALVHAEHAIVRLLLTLADVYGASRPLAPYGKEGVHLRLVQAIATWHGSPDLARTLTPPMAGYDALRGALHRYHAIVESGGFLPVPDKVRRARPGRVHPGIPALRARLAQEDPMDVGAGDRWDDALTEALRRARHAHQLRVPRRNRRRLMDKRLLKELAVPAPQRVASIRRNLERLRKSRFRDYAYAVRVNLPDFHGEVWDGPDRVHRFKIVIGNAKRTKAGALINRTPLLQAPIHSVVFNPYWNVPSRIVREELVPAAKKHVARKVEELQDAWANGDAGPTVAGEGGEPAVVPPGTDVATASAQYMQDYWKGKGFEVIGERDDGPAYVRGVPGPGNALGKVKFVFDNPYYVYMHDTPHKAKFRAARRAFSHGCMRVQRPLDLARLLMKRDGTWKKAERYRVLRHHKETRIRLANPVTLVVEYITARVDDSGRVHWLTDVYREDGPTIAGRYPL